jgi:hypothetical protein
MSGLRSRGGGGRQFVRWRWPGLGGVTGAMAPASGSGGHYGRDARGGMPSVADVTAELLDADDGGTARPWTSSAQPAGSMRSETTGSNGDLQRPRRSPPGPRSMVRTRTVPQARLSCVQDWAIRESGYQILLAVMVFANHGQLCPPVGGGCTLLLSRLELWHPGTTKPVDITAESPRA